MSAVNRALRIARQARQTGGTADQQPEEQQAASSSYLPAMTAPMGANTADYARISGYNSASALDNAAWQGPPQQPQEGQQAPQAHGPVPPQPPPSAPPQQMSQPQGPQAAPQAHGPVPPQPPAGPNALQKLGEALKLGWGQDQAPAPSKGGKPVINAAGKNTVQLPGTIDGQGNEVEAPSNRRVQDAIKNTADASGLTGKIDQEKTKQAQQQNTWSKLFQQAQAAAPHGNVAPSGMTAGSPMYTGQRQQPATPPAPQAPAAPKLTPGVQKALDAINQFTGKPYADIVQAMPDETVKKIFGYDKQTVLQYGRDRLAEKFDPSDPRIQGYLGGLGISPQDYNAALQAQKKQGAGLPSAPPVERDQAPPPTPGYGAIPNQKDRPYRYSGTLSMGGNSYHFTTGGGQFSSLPYGTYSVNMGAIGPIGQRIGAIAGISDSNQGNTVNDPNYGPRAGVEIHSLDGRNVTNGCLGIAPGEYQQFAQDLQKFSQQYGGHASLTIKPDGTASIGPPSNTEVADKGASTPAGFTSNVNKDITNPQDRGRDYSPGAAPRADGAVSSAGSAGQGTPEQEARFKHERFMANLREVLSGQADPMLGYKQLEAEAGLMNAWTDWDAKRSIRYGDMSPPQAAQAASNELAAFKEFHGAALSAVGNAGAQHPGGSTTAPSASGGPGGGQHFQNAPQPTGEPLTPEEQAVQHEMGLANNMAQTAQRYMSRGAGTPYFAEGVKMLTDANKSVADLAKNEAATSLLRKQGAMLGWVQGQFGWQNLVNPRAFIPYTQPPGQGLEPSSPQRAASEPEPQPSRPSTQSQGPSIGGTGEPASPPPMGGAAPTVPSGAMMPPPAQGNVAANKPLPASPALAAEQKKKNEQQPPGYSETDVLAHPALRTDFKEDDFGPITRRDWDRNFYLDSKSWGTRYDKKIDEASARMQTAEQKMGRVIAIQHALAQLHEQDLGWGSDSRTHAAEALNSIGHFFNGYLGTQFPEIKPAQVGSYELAERQLAGMAFDALSKTEGGAGRSRFAAKFLGESLSNLNDAPRALKGTLSLMKQDYQSDVDFYNGLSIYKQQGRNPDNYITDFYKHNPRELYDLRATLEANGVKGQDLDYLLQHPEEDQAFDKAYGYGAAKLLRSRSGRRP